MTFNMQFGQGWDPRDPESAPVALDQTIAFLREHPVDILFLQEVEQARTGGEQSPVPENFTRIESALPEYHSTFAYPPVNPDELPFGIGLAIFARQPLVGVASESLPPADISFQFNGRPHAPSHRQVLSAQTRIAGQTIQLHNTHLQAFFMIGSTSLEHRAQRDRIAEILQSASGPTLLAGDMNCSPDEGLVEQFVKQGFQTAQNSEITWRHRPYVTDHIFYNPPLKVEHVEVIPTWCSDHHAVKTQLRIDRSNTR